MLDRQNEPLGPNAEDDVATLARKVDFLSRCDSYISAPETVTVRETHMPWVFMAGDRVYRLKKPVRFPRFFYARATGYSLSRGDFVERQAGAGRISSCGSAVSDHDGLCDRGERHRLDKLAEEYSTHAGYWRRHRRGLLLGSQTVDTSKEVVICEPF